MECFIGNTTVYYEEYGQGTPILCLHGFPEDHSVMVGCIEPICNELNGYRRIYLDLPGMGNSPATDTIKNADDMLSLLKQFIHTVIGNESFLLVGLSYGGYLALGLTRDTKLHIDGIFLICPCVVAAHKNRTLPAKNVAFEQAGFASSMAGQADFNEFLEFAVVVSANTWARYKNEVLAGIQKADDKFTRRYQTNGYSFSFEDKLHELTFQKPVYVLTGRQDNCVGYEDAWHTTKALPHLTFLTVDGAGHNLQIEAPELFAFHFKDWLAKATVQAFL